LQEVADFAISMAKKYNAQLLILCVYIENWDLIREYEENLIAYVVMKSRFTIGQKILVLLI
jgi:hypothetical protein